MIQWMGKCKLFNNQSHQISDRSEVVHRYPSVNRLKISPLFSTLFPVKIKFFESKFNYYFFKRCPATEGLASVLSECPHNTVPMSETHHIPNSLGSVILIRTLSF